MIRFCLGVFAGLLLAEWLRGYTPAPPAALCDEEGRLRPLFLDEAAWGRRGPGV